MFNTILILVFHSVSCLQNNKQDLSQDDSQTDPDSREINDYNATAKLDKVFGNKSPHNVPSRGHLANKGSVIYDQEYCDILPESKRNCKSNGECEIKCSIIREDKENDVVNKNKNKMSLLERLVLKQAPECIKNDISNNIGNNMGNNMSNNMGNNISDSSENDSIFNLEDNTTFNLNHIVHNNYCDKILREIKENMYYDQYRDYYKEGYLLKHRRAAVNVTGYEHAGLAFNPDVVEEAIKPGSTIKGSNKKKLIIKHPLIHNKDNKNLRHTPHYWLAPDERRPNEDSDHFMPVGTNFSSRRMSHVAKDIQNIKNEQGNDYVEVGITN